MVLALEDVLQTGDLHEAVAGQPLPIEDYENLHYLLGRRYRNKRNKEAANTAAAAAAAPPAGGTVANEETDGTADSDKQQQHGDASHKSEGSSKSFLQHHQFMGSATYLLA